MDINLVVTLTFSERLFQLIERHVPTIQHRVENAVNKQVKASAKEETRVKVAITTDPPSPACVPAPADPIVAVDEARAEAAKATKAKPAKKTKAAEQPEQPEQPEQTEQTAQTAQTDAPAAEATDKPVDKPTEQQIRDIMTRTYIRIEGDDYPNNGGSERAKKYHKALNSQFRQIAALLGYEKPTKIDDPEKIARFAAECDALIIDENGLISPPKAPF